MKRFYENHHMTIMQPLLPTILTAFPRRVTSVPSSRCAAACPPLQQTATTKGIHYQRKNGYGWRSVSRIELDPFPLHPNNQNLNLIQCNEKGPQTLGTFFPVLNFCFWHPWKHDCHCQFSSKHTNTKQCLALSKVLFNCTLFKMLVNFFTSAYL